MSKLYIYGDIVGSVEDTYYNEGAIYPQLVIDYLNKNLDSDVEIHINSSGGSVFDGVAISNAIKRHEGKTTAYIDGLAASISSVIALSCDEVVMCKGSYLMVHKPLVVTVGNSEELLNLAEQLDNIEKNIINDFYLPAAKEGVTYEMLAEKMNAETWLNTEQATEIFNIKTETNIYKNYNLGNNFRNYKKAPREVIENKQDVELQKIKEIEIELEV